MLLKSKKSNYSAQMAAESLIWAQVSFFFGLWLDPPPLPAVRDSCSATPLLTHAFFPFICIWSEPSDFLRTLAIGFMPEEPFIFNRILLDRLPCLCWLHPPHAWITIHCPMSGISESGCLWFCHPLFVIATYSRWILHLAVIPCSGAVEVEQI